MFRPYIVGDVAKKGMILDEHAPVISPDTIRLREVIAADLPIFFEHQRDAEANVMAAFTARDPNDWAAFMAHWAKILAEPTVINRTILVAGNVAGNVAKFEDFGAPEIGYWIGRRYWGQGVATSALAAFLPQIPVRPVYAHVAQDNRGSIRVLEKCGFVICGHDKEFSNARGSEVEALVLMRDA